jgi:hypothetical protein
MTAIAHQAISAATLRTGLGPYNHQPVSRLSGILENWAKSARVRAICLRRPTQRETSWVQASPYRARRGCETGSLSKPPTSLSPWIQVSPPRFTTAWLDVSVCLRREAAKCSECVTNHICSAGQMGTAFFIPAPEMVKANIGLYRNALMKLAARFPRPEGPNPLDHCEKKRRG